MTATRHPDSAEEQPSELLAVLQQLCAEMQAANLALAANNLTGFRTHVSRLDELSASLLQLPSQRPSVSELADCSHAPARALEGRIQAERYRLAETSYRLSALMRRCRRSVGLLARHYRMMFPTAGTSEGCAPDLHTWSSEV